MCGILHIVLCIQIACKRNLFDLLVYYYVITTVQLVFQQCSVAIEEGLRTDILSSDAARTKHKPQLMQAHENSALSRVASWSPHSRCTRRLVELARDAILSTLQLRGPTCTLPLPNQQTQYPLSSRRDTRVVAADSEYQACLPSARFACSSFSARPWINLGVIIIWLG